MSAVDFPVTLAASFRARFPEFTSGNYPDATVEIALEDAALQINPNAWGRKAGLGQIYLAAHTMALFGPASLASPGTVATGVITSESVGEISRSYANPYGSMAPGSADFGLSRYGQLYERLKRQIASSPMVL